MAILREVTRHRRHAGPSACVPTAPCAACVAPHLPRIVARVERNLPIAFVLPAFPGKSPNLGKVLGPLPDMGERRALTFLQHLCERIGQIYRPAAHITLASDGRVFSDVVGMRDEDVTAYHNALRAMISALGLGKLATSTLEDRFATLSFDAMRTRLVHEFGAPVEEIQAAVRRAARDPQATADDHEQHRLYLGITRFLVEDATFPGQTKTRNALQTECRRRAYQVIQRSQAWSSLIEHHFPGAVRLSIHPQGCGSRKLGLHLMDVADGDGWLTPWHAVALERAPGRFTLTQRSVAEAQGARLVLRDGRPSHFTVVA